MGSVPRSFFACQQGMPTTATMSTLTTSWVVSRCSHAGPRPREVSHRGAPSPLRRESERSRGLPRGDWMRTGRRRDGDLDCLTGELGSHFRSRPLGSTLWGRSSCLGGKSSPSLRKFRSETSSHSEGTCSPSSLKMPPTHSLPARHSTHGLLLLLDLLPPARIYNGRHRGAQTRTLKRMASTRRATTTCQGAAGGESTLIQSSDGIVQLALAATLIGVLQA